MATIQRLDKTCPKCNTPMIRVIRKGKRPFNMCLATDCETKADWGKKGKKGAKGKKAPAKVKEIVKKRTEEKTAK